VIIKLTRVEEINQGGKNGITAKGGSSLQRKGGGVLHLGAKTFWAKRREGRKKARQAMPWRKDPFFSLVQGGEGQSPKKKERDGKLERDRGSGLKVERRGDSPRLIV